MEFTLPMPVGINHLYKQGKHGWYKDSKAVLWQDKALWMIKDGRRFNKHRNHPEDKPRGDKVHIVWYRGDLRKWDIDSGLKLLLDTLVKAEVIGDDNDIMFLTVEKKYNKGGGNFCVVKVF